MPAIPRPFDSPSTLYVRDTPDATNSASPNNASDAPEAGLPDANNTDDTAITLIINLTPFFCIIPIVLAYVLYFRYGIRRKAKKAFEAKSQQESRNRLSSSGSSSDVSESATVVSKLQEDDEKTMPFLKGLFRVAASSTEKQASGWHSVDALPGPHDQGQEHSFPTCSSSIQTSSTFRRRGSDIDDRELFSPPSPAFHGSWRPRSLSETGIIRSPGSSRSASFTSLSLSPPSSPLSSSGANRLSNSSVASLSSSEKFENRINKQLQKKTSSSNLRFGHLSFEMDSGRIDKKRMKPVRRSTFPLNDTVLGISGSDIENGDGGRRKGCSHICDSSMDFQCRGLPDSGTFSKLTDAEAAVRAEDELATIQRLQVGRHS